MATLTVQNSSVNGIQVNYIAADPAGDVFPNDGRTEFRVKNDGASQITVTIESVSPCNYGFDHDVVATVDAGQEKVFGPFKRERFNDSQGQVSVTYSDTTNVTVAAVRVV